jgi:hypothetical protein
MTLIKPAMLSYRDVLRNEKGATLASRPFICHFK